MRYTFIFILALVGLTPQIHAHKIENINDVKAQFLVNFIDYITWPNAEENTDPQAHNICMYNDQTLYQSTAQVIEKERKNTKIIPHNLSSMNDASSCHILYLHAADYSQIKTIQSPNNILIIGDSKEIFEYGGVIHMGEGEHHVIFSINQDNARKQNFSISSKLLKISKIDN